MRLRAALLILTLCWFSIGTGEWLLRGFPQMLYQWRVLRPVGDNLDKRNLILPDWALLVRAARRHVPSGSDLAFLSDADEERYTYLRFLLNYEIYPLRPLTRADYERGARPRFLISYAPKHPDVAADGYRTRYAAGAVRVLERTF
jgi:hypothetical protein